MEAFKVLAGVAVLALSAHAAAADPGKAKAKDAPPAGRPVTVATYGFEASSMASARAEARAPAADLQKIERARAESGRLAPTFAPARLVARPDGSLKARRN